MKKRYMLGGIGLLIDVVEKIVKSNRPTEKEIRPIYSVNERLTANYELIDQKIDERRKLISIR